MSLGVVVATVSQLYFQSITGKLGFVGDKQDAVRPAVIVDTIPQIKEVAGFPYALQIKSVVGQLVDFVMGYYSKRVEMNSRKRLYSYLLFVLDNVSIGRYCSNTRTPSPMSSLFTSETG